MHWLIHAPTAAVALVAVALAFGIAVGNLVLNDENPASDARTVHGYIFVILGIVTIGFSIVAANGERADKQSLGAGAVILMLLAVFIIFFAGFHMMRKERNDTLFAQLNLAYAVALGNLAARSAEYSPAGDNGGSIAFHELSIFLNGVLIGVLALVGAILLFKLVIAAIKYTKTELK